MITNKDLEIENISYTNKDFGQIYPELLELVKKVTNKWDPESTNESDPGIVLLKLLAFIGDKLNYNIDKNTLEQFIVSATQEISMRRLTEMLGYNMKYYRSATTKVSFRYLGDLGITTEDESDVLASRDSFCIKAFDTTFKTEDDIVYTLLEDMIVTNQQKLSTSKLAMQGQLKVLNVLGSDDTSSSTLVQLYNLDDQNRIFFPDVEVAENGVFINKEIYDSIMSDPTEVWHRVDNLNDQELGHKVFKFGYDSDTGFPYIQFPKDISTLIEDGLEIWYIVSSGENGKVLNNKLTKFNTLKITTDSSASATELLTSLDDDIYVITNSSSTEAYNPETLTEAYNNFKQVIGTFNTLVSCKDYSNYINRYVSDDSTYLVSNVIVTDLRTDPQYSKPTFIRDTNGNSFYDNIIDSEKITPAQYYNLVLHGTIPVNQIIQTLNEYEKTYQCLDESSLININVALEDIKTINHNITRPAVTETSFIEADYTLKCNVTTKYKVNSTEQKEIIKNIKQALYENFNARQVEFGEEIPYDSFISVIQNADTRIKNISLSDPDVEYYLKSVQGKTKFDVKTNVEIIIDNVRAGTLPLYYEDTSFRYDYDMDLGSIQPINKLAALKAEVKVQNGHKLKENEVIQLVEDSYLTQLTYPAYIYYAFSTDKVKAGDLAIKANSTYKLSQNETLYITYTDSSDIKRYITYTEGQIIKPNFDIVNTKGLAKISNAAVSVEKKTASKFVNWSQRLERSDLSSSIWESAQDKNGIIPLFSIGTNEQIDILKRHEVNLSANTECFWYIKPKVKEEVDSKGNITSIVSNEHCDILFEKDREGKYSYILEEGEMFIYPNEDMTSLNVLGGGTKLEYSEASIIRSSSDIINLSTLQTSVEDEDVGTFKKSFNWQTFDKPLTIVESSISTYVEGDTITSFTLESGDTIDSSWANITSLVVNDENVTISNQTNPRIRSILSVISSNTDSQKVYEGQDIYYYVSNISEQTQEDKGTITKNKFEEGSYIQTYPELDTYNNLIALQDLKYLTDDDGNYYPETDVDGNYLHTYYNYNIVNYKLKEQPDTYTSTLSDLILYLKAINKKSINTRDEYRIDYYYLKQFFDKIGATDYKLTVDISSGIEDLYINVFDTNSGTTILYGPDDVKESKITIDLNEFIIAGDTSKTLFISKPKILKVYDYLKEVSSDIITTLKQIRYYDWIGPRNSSKFINSYTPLYSFFDKNNVYNKLTLPKIDFDTSEFNIVGSSKI